jgi:hypothetical protein
MPINPLDIPLKTPVQLLELRVDAYISALSNEEKDTLSVLKYNAEVQAMACKAAEIAFEALVQTNCPKGDRSVGAFAAVIMTRGIKLTSEEIRTLEMETTIAFAKERGVVFNISEKKAAS